MASTKVVVITGAAGRIAYSLIPLLCDGSVFSEEKISLRLFDMEFAKDRLGGVTMEVEDSGFPYLNDVISTTFADVAFAGADVCVLLGGFPRSPGMERKDLIAKNAKGMKEQAQAIVKYGKADCKVVVVANPANTNCLVVMKEVLARGLSPKNITCLTRLDHERFRGFLAEMVNSKLLQQGSESGGTGTEAPTVLAGDVMDVAIFGNHSATQVPYGRTAKVRVKGEIVPITKYLSIAEIDGLTSKVQKRGAAVMNAQQASSGMSAAAAIAKHIKSWLGPIPTNNETFSMGIISDGNTYGVPDGLCFSFPCRRVEGAVAGTVEIVDGLHIDPTIQAMIDLTTTELNEEKQEALSILEMNMSV